MHTFTSRFPYMSMASINNNDLLFQLFRLFRGLWGPLQRPWTSLTGQLTPRQSFNRVKFSTD